MQSIGYAAPDSRSPLAPFTFEREAVRAGELEIEVLYCGVCHSDLHQARDEWHNTVYPCVPGHEVVGRVVSVGDEVTRFAPGDLAGVGCMIDSCGTCERCRAGEENYCEGPNSWLATYNGPMIPASQSPDGGNIYRRDNTFGGYSDRLVVPEKFALRIPDALAPEHAAPLLCAGATTYSPLKRWGAGPGKRVGVIGLGGLGHVAVKLAVAMGADVVAFTTHADKADAARALGASHVVREDDADGLKSLERQFDLILSTVPEKHDVNPFLQLLKTDGALVIVGALEPLEPIDNQQLAFHRRSVSGSLIGSLAETQEVLEFCAEHGIVPDIERIRIDQINDAFERMSRGDVRFRFVIDGASLRRPSP